MEDYLKDSEETRNLELKVYELDVQRYKLIISAYKSKLDELSLAHEEFVRNTGTSTSEEVKNLKDLLTKNEKEHRKVVGDLKKSGKEEVQRLEKELERLQNDRIAELEKLKEEMEVCKSENCELKNRLQETVEKAKVNDSQEIKNLRKEIKDLKKIKGVEEGEIVKDLKKDLKDMTKKLEQFTSKEIPLLKKENELLSTKLSSLKSLEKEFKDLKQAAKIKEKEWFESISRQNQELLEKLESGRTYGDKLDSICSEILKIHKSLKKQPVQDFEILADKLRGILQEFVTETVSSGNDLKDRTIKTLKASNDLKSNIIKKQVEKISQVKTHSDSSEDSIIKPEDDQSSVVFGLGDLNPKKNNQKPQSTSSPKKTKIDQPKKKGKSIPFDDAVLKAAVGKKNLPIVKKPLLPKDSKKLNNASFFANITFTDSSPVIKRDANKK